MIRTTDRIEALLVATLAVVLLCGAVLAGAVGTAVHDARARVYSERNTGLTQVDGTVVGFDNTVTGRSAAQVRWTDSDGERVADVLRAGLQPGPVSLWIDDQGRVATPTDVGLRAGLDAVAAGVGSGLAAGVVAFALFAVSRRTLDRRRDGHWQHALENLFRADDRLT